MAGCTPKFSMRNVLFVNSQNPVCGVHQYGCRMWDLLYPSQKYLYHYCSPESFQGLVEHVSAFRPDAIIYNWADGIGGYMGTAAWPFGAANLLLYHDGGIPVGVPFDRILYSDPTMEPDDRWRCIGRPLAMWEPDGFVEPTHMVPWIGVSGFMGAWADIAVHRIVEEFDSAVIRLHLPAAPYGDPVGAQAERSSAVCWGIVQHKPGITLDVVRHFLPPSEYLKWLSCNDLNVYMRGPHWPGRGVASVLDCALAVKKPIAVDRSHAFRHVHNLEPSICVEDSSLKTILANGTKPLEPLLEKWAPANVRAEIEDIIGSFGLRD